MTAEQLLNEYNAGRRDFTNLKLVGLNLSRLNDRLDLRDADFSGSNLSHVKFKGTILRNCKFNGSDLEYADLSYTNLIDAKFIKANIRGGDLTHADLRCAIFTEADLSYSTLFSVDIKWAEFGSANLRCADLKYAFIHDKFKRKHFKDAILDGAFFDDDVKL